MSTKKLLFLFCSIPTFAFTQSLNDTTKISEVIIQENRFQIPFNQHSRNIQVLTQKDLKKLPSSSINEVLRYVSGVDIRQRGPFGTQADIGIDGGSFDQTLVLINGVKLSDPQTGHHMLNIPIPLEAIERIEILRGPASRMYGINALTGAVNIVTKQVEHNSVFTHLYAGSSFDKVEETDKDGIYYGTGIQVGGTFYNKSNQHQLYASKEHSNGQRYNTGSDNERIYYQNNLVINSDNRIQMMAGYMNNKFGANGYYATPGDINSEELVETFLSSISSQHQLNDHWYLNPRINYRYNDDDYRYFKDDLSKGRSHHYTHTLSAELNAYRQFKYGDLGLGVESRHEKINSSNIGDHSRNNLGFFTEFRSTYFRKFIFNLGAYINYNSDYDWQVFPGLDISYLINDNWKISASSGTSQRIPTFTDLYLNQRPGNIGNPDLKSENAWQNEIGTSYTKGNLSIRAGYFYRDIDNFIDWMRESTDVPYQANNLGNNKTHGIFSNFLYNYQIAERKSLNFNFSYSYLKPSIVNNYKNSIIKYGIESLKHQAIGTISFHTGNWNFITANRWLQRTTNNSYFVSDARIAFQKSKYTIYGDIQNIFDAQYIEVGAVPMPSRWATLGFKYNVSL